MGNCVCCVSSNNKVAHEQDDETKKEEEEPKKCLNGHLVITHKWCPEGYEDKKIPC